MANPLRANALDRLIGVFNPARALRRIADRTRLERAYEAASPRDTWKPRRSGASAQADHMADATLLRSKARALVQNVPYIAAGMDALVANVIGTGIMLRFTGPRADLLNTLWAKWVTVCDADARLDFFGLEAASYRAMEQDGELLVRIRPRLAADKLPVPLQLQLLEIDWLDSSRNSMLGGGSGVPAGNVVIEGIEYDPLGRVAAYWLWDQHPGDATLLRGFRNFSKRLPAANIIHLFDPKRPGQARGITRLAPIIARTRDTQLLEDAHLARKNLEARLSVLVSGDASLMANEFQQGSTGANGEADAALARRTGDLGELVSGSITELPAGNEVTFIDPKATPGHVEDIKHHLHIITAAMGVTYESVTGDMSEATFSSARMRQNDVRRQVEHTQWMVFIPRFCRSIADAFVRAAIDAGKVPSNTSYDLEYDTPKWDYVNPAQEAQADALQVATGLSSLSAKLRARGENPAKVFAEIKTDFDTLKELGVLDILFFLQKGSVRISDQPSADQQAADAEATGQRAPSERAPAPPPELHINIAPPQVEIRAGDTHAHVHMPEGMVRADIHTPEVKVGDVTVNVPTPQVTVQHPKRAVQVVERDPKTHEIKRTETDFEN